MEKDHWINTKARTIEEGMDVSNFDAMIEDYSTPASTVFTENEYNKWLYYECTKDPKLRLEYRYGFAVRKVTQVLNGEVDVAETSNENLCTI